MLQHFLREGQTQICLLIVRIIADTLLSIRNSQSIVLKFDIGKRSICKINGNFVFWNTRSLRTCSFNCFSIILNSLFEVVVF